MYVQECGNCRHYAKRADDSNHWVGHHGGEEELQVIGYGKCQAPGIPYFLLQFVKRNAGADCTCFIQKEAKWH